MSFSLCHFLFASKANYLLREIAERLPLFLDLFIYFVFWGEVGLHYSCLHADRSHQIVPQGRQSRLFIVGTVKREECYCLLMQIGVNQEVKCWAQSQRTVIHSVCGHKANEFAVPRPHLEQHYASERNILFFINSHNESIHSECTWLAAEGDSWPATMSTWWHKTLRKVLSHP